MHKNTTERKLVNITQRVPVFASKNQHDYKCDPNFMQQFNRPFHGIRHRKIRSSQCACRGQKVNSIPLNCVLTREFLVKTKLRAVPVADFYHRGGKARTHRDEYQRTLFASVFQRVCCVHTQAIFADDEPSEHANSFPDIRWRLI